MKMENHTLVVCNNSLTLNQQQIVETLSWWLDIVAYIIIGIMGLCLNILAVRILLSPTMWNNFFNRLIMCLSAYDSLFILCGLLEILRKWCKTSVQQYLFAKVLYPFRSMAMCCSIYTTIVLTLERYQAITSPIEYRNRSASLSLGKRLFTSIVPVMLFSFLYYTPKFFDLYLEEVSDCEWKNNSSLLNNSWIIITEENITECDTELRIYPSDLRIHQQYIFWYLNVSNVIVTCLIPVGFLVFLNCRIVSSLQEYRQRRPIKARKDNDPTIKNKESTRQNTDVKQTFILFSIVILFVFCHALRIIMNITEMWNLNIFYTQQDKSLENSCDEMSLWQHISIPISEILLLFNSSTNFFVYLFFDKGFQLVLKEKFGCFKCRLKTSDSPQPEIIPLKPKPRHTQEINENGERVNQVESKEHLNVRQTDDVVTTTTTHLLHK